MSKAKNTTATPHSTPVSQGGFRRTAALVLPTYSTKNLKEGDSIVLRLLSEMVSKPDVDQKTGEQKLDKKGQPALIYIAQVQDMNSGEMGEMVVPVIMQHAFEAAAPISGKMFELVKGRAEANKATKWEVYTVEAV